MLDVQFLAPLLFAVAASPSLAQEAQCFQNENALVIAQERTDEVGTSFIIRSPARGKIKCSFVPAAGDFVIDTDPLWYAGLAGSYLALTESTGPDGSVVIYDLPARQRVVDVPADDAVTVTENSITYWERTQVGTARTCPEFAEYTADGLGAVVAEETVFDVASGRTHRTGETHCSPTQ